MSGQLERVRRNFASTAAKKLPESVICLTAVEEITLNHCNLIGSVPDGIGALKNLTILVLSNNSLTGTLSSSLNLLVALETLNLFDNELSGGFPDLPNLCALSTLYLDPDFGKKYVLLGDGRFYCNRHKFSPDVGGYQESESESE